MIFPCTYQTMESYPIWIRTFLYLIYMKKILLVIPSIKFWWWAEWAIIELANKLMDEWFDVTLMTFYDFPGDEYVFTGNRISLHEWVSQGNFSRLLKLFFRAWKIHVYTKNTSISTIISFMEDANFPLLLSKSLFRLKQKCIISIRHSLSDYVGSIYEKWIRLFYPSADMIVVLTAHEKEYLHKNYLIDFRKITIIHNSIDRERAHMRASEILPWMIKHDTTFVFVTIGRLTGIKNQKLLIEAYKKLREEYENIALWLLGDGPLKWELEQSTKWDNSITFFWNQKNIYPYLKNASCFVLTSFSEAFPNVILQAMAMWLPVISTDTQWSREILPESKYGIIVGNNELGELVWAMKDVYGNPNIKDTLISGSIMRVWDFELSHIIEQWRRIF